MSGRVIVIGSVNVDLVVSGARLPGPGETVTGGLFERHDGGKGGNQAVAAARLGARVEFIGAVGGTRSGPRRGRPWRLPGSAWPGWPRRRPPRALP